VEEAEYDGVAFETIPFEDLVICPPTIRKPEQAYGLGEQYTVCDPYLFTIAGWLEGDRVDLADATRLLRHR